MMTSDRDSRECGSNRGTVLLIACLVASEIGYVSLLSFDAINGLRPVLIFLATMVAEFVLLISAVAIVRAYGCSRATLLVVAAGSVLFRATLLPAGLPPALTFPEKITQLGGELTRQEVVYERFQLYDSDVWRYLWDAHLVAHHVNPYRYAPSSPELDEMAERGVDPGAGAYFWQDVRDNINYPDTRTIYPPGAQFVFLLAHMVAPGSVLAMKLIAVLVDLLACWALLAILVSTGRPRYLVLLYAWNPLVIKVFAGSGHIDSVVVAALLGTVLFSLRTRIRLVVPLFALSILSKLFPVLLAPFLYRRFGLKPLLSTAGLVLLGYLPFLGVGLDVFSGLRAFSSTWEFNAGPYELVLWVCELVVQNPSFLARTICGLAVVTVVGWCIWRDDGSDESLLTSMTASIGAILVASPAVMPWYVAWVLPIAIVARRFEWVAFSCIVLMAFLVMIDERERAWALWVEYGLLFIAWLVFRRTEVRNDTQFDDSPDSFADSPVHRFGAG